MSGWRCRNPGNWAGVGVALVLVAGCGEREEATGEERTLAIAEAPAVVTVTLGGQVEYRDRETVKPPVGDLMLAWLIEDGLSVEPGDVVARFDVELLDLWLQGNRQELEILERRRRAALLSNARETEQLRNQLAESEAEERALKLQYEESKRRDEAQREVLRKELELAQTTLAEAEAKLTAIKNLSKLGGAAAKEVRDAVVAYERERAKLRIPQIRLQVFEETTGSTERMVLDQDLAAVRLALGDEADHGSLRSKLGLAIKKQAQRLSEHEKAVAEQLEEAEEYQAVVDDPTYRAGQGGITAHYDSREAPMIPGAVLGDRSLLRVYPPEQAVVSVHVPEEMRDALSAAVGEAVTAKIRIPAMENCEYEGRLTALSTTKRRYPPTYQGTVAFLETPQDLKVGTTVACEVAVPVPAGCVVIPQWWASTDFVPRVRLRDGTERELRARRFGDWLIVEEGLTVGEVLAPPPRQSRQSLWLRGKVEAPNAEVIKVSGRSWNWVVEELIDDGAEVRSGDVVATLRQRRGRLPTEEAAQLAELKADAKRQLAELAANGDFGDAYLSWQEAEVAARKARLNYLIERYAVDDEGIVSADVDAELKTLAEKEALADAERLQAEIYEQVYSQSQLRDKKLSATVAGLESEQAARKAVAARHFRKWPQVWKQQQAYFEASLTAEKQQQAYQLAKIKRRKALAQAAADYEAAMRRAAEIREQANGSILRAPFAGRVYYSNRGYRPLEAGRRLPTSEPLIMPKDTKRRFHVNVPARLYGEFRAGDEISFFLPAEGAVTRRGRIRHVADFFEKKAVSALAAEDADDDDEAASEASVRIEIEFDADETVGVPPGSTAVVEIAQ